MYTEASISALIKRIGWSEVQSSDHNLTLVDENKEAESGRTFDSFHALVTIDNIFDAVPKVGMEIANFNAFLLDVKKQHAAKVLTLILNQNEKYIDSFDYDNTILQKLHLFDEPLGYSVAASMIELFITTSRNNLRERNAKMAYDKLKIELEGLKNERGIKVAAGINEKLQESVRTATNIIFPKPIIVDSKQVW